MLWPYGVEDVVPLYSMLQHIILADAIVRWQMEWPPHIIVIIINMLADVIAQWQMEWPLQGGGKLSTGRCYYQVADGCSWVELF